MRARTSIAVLAAGAAALVLAGWTGGLAPHASLFADNRPGAIVVDAELVIAVDVSNSMDPEEQALQREGYILGLTSREFLNALRSGINGKIAVTVGDREYELGAGDCLAFVLDRPTAYRNRSRKLARYAVVVVAGSNFTG